MFVEIPAEDLVSVYVSETFLKENGELVKTKISDSKRPGI